MSFFDAEEGFYHGYTLGLFVEYLNRDGKKSKLKAKDLLAQALCHEIDHLDGILYTDKAMNLEDIPVEE